MAIDLTGITNENEFYTHHYLAAILEGDLKPLFEAWSPMYSSNRLTLPVRHHSIPSKNVVFPIPFGPLISVTPGPLGRASVKLFQLGRMVRRSQSLRGKKTAFFIAAPDREGRRSRLRRYASECRSKVHETSPIARSRIRTCIRHMFRSPFGGLDGDSVHLASAGGERHLFAHRRRFS